MTPSRLVGRPSTMGDDHQLNTTTLIRHAARTFGDQPIAYRDRGEWQSYTFAECYERVCRAAQALTQLGIGAGDTVGVLDWNSRRHFELYWAIPGIAAVMLQLNLRLADEDLSYVVRHSEAEWIAVDESLLPLAERIAAANPQIKGWILLSDRPHTDTGIDPSVAPLHDYEELLDKQYAAMEWAEIDERSAYSACYTTGTTGRPKGVYYSHRSIYLHAMAEAAALNMGPTDTTMLITPMFHAQCWGLPQAATLAGSKIVLPGRYRADDAELLVEAFLKFHVSVANGAPVIFEPILDYIRKNDITLDLRGARLLSGSTEPPLELMRGLSDETGAELIHAYGATETSPLVAVNRRKPHLPDSLGETELWELKRKQGLPVIGVDLVLLDENGQPQPHDGASVGEICLRGPWISAHYHATPDSEDHFTSDGYWRSGDVGTIDASGYLKLTDRIKDVIKSGGEWISSIDLENALLGHTAVREAAVVGVPHRRWQERAVGVVVPHEGAMVTEQELQGHLASRFAKWQIPERIIVQSHLPRTSVGKIKKADLREQLWDTYREE